MTEDELNAKLIEIRQGRRVQPKPTKTPKAKEINIDKISPEAASRILEMLKKRKK